MHCPADALQALVGCGYTEREARFLYIVAVHSGHFVRSQYACFCYGKPKNQPVTQESGGSPISNLVAKLVGKKHARQHGYGPRGFRYHLHYKPFYRLIGQPDSRNRRADASLTLINERLAGLDFILEQNEDVSFFDSIETRVAHFRALGVPIESLPAAMYVFRNATAPSVVYFPDKYPLGMRSDGSLVFAYCDEQTQPLEAFKTHLTKYLPLFRSLDRPWSLSFVSPVRGEKSHRAQQAFVRLVHGPAPVLDENAERYFRIKRLYLAKDWQHLTHHDFVDRLKLGKVYETLNYCALYQRWANGLPIEDRPRAAALDTAKFEAYHPFSFPELPALAS